MSDSTSTATHRMTKPRALAVRTILGCGANASEASACVVTSRSAHCCRPVKDADTRRRSSAYTPGWREKERRVLVDAVAGCMIEMLRHGPITFLERGLGVQPSPD